MLFRVLKHIDRILGGQVRNLISGDARARIRSHMWIELRSSLAPIWTYMGWILEIKSTVLLLVIDTRQTMRTQLNKFK